VAEEGQRLKPPRVMAVLRQHLPRETLVVGDTGATAVHLGRYLPVYSADGFFALYALAPMGSGIPLALGVQVARPDATVVSVIGDGGFQTHAGELSVAAQHDLPVIYVIVNNGLYGSIAERQMRLFGQLYTSVVKNPDFAALARSFGCDGYSVQTEQELRTAIDSAVAARRPSVIDVRVDSEFEQLPPEIAEREAALLKVDLSPKWPFPSTRKP
jgi:acetolactate synthase-1/2/3 large subunit